MLLAIDTATRVASLALYGPDGLVAESTWRSRENHTVELTLQILALLRTAHAEIRALKAIGVALGPGSFTGLRVGMSTGKGIAYGAGIPVLGVPTLDAIAQSFAHPALAVWAVLAAGRGRYSVARYASRPSGPTRTSEIALVDASGLLEFVERADKTAAAGEIFCGDIDAGLGGVISSRLGPGAVVATPAANARRAGFLAELAWARLARGESDDLAALAPIYTPMDYEANKTSAAAAPKHV